MNKRFFFMVISVLIILSCEKKDSEDFLTNGTWVLDDNVVSTTTQTLKFDTNGQYQFVSELTMHGQLGAMSGSVSGEYYRQGKQIHFTSTLIGLPEGTGVLPDFDDSRIIGLPISILHILNQWRNDSTFIDSLAIIGDTDITPGELYDNTRIWEIVKLNHDSLIVESNDDLLKYYKQ